MIETQEQALAEAGLTRREVEYRGYRAHECGRDRMDNPYEIDSVMYEIWLYGWDAAFADADKRDRKQDV